MGDFWYQFMKVDAESNRNKLSFADHEKVQARVLRFLRGYQTVLMSVRNREQFEDRYSKMWTRLAYMLDLESGFGTEKLQSGSMISAQAQFWHKAKKTLQKGIHTHHEHTRLRKLTSIESS